MNINKIQDQIIDEFARMEDLYDKYELLVAYGKQIPAMDNKYKTEKNEIKNCQSRLWIACEIVDSKMIFHVYSDSEIVRGMAAVVLKVVNNQTPQVVAENDLYFIKGIGLNTLLSPIRANGLATMVKRINELADNCVAEDRES